MPLERNQRDTAQLPTMVDDMDASLNSLVMSPIFDPGLQNRWQLCANIKFFGGTLGWCWAEHITALSLFTDIHMDFFMAPVFQNKTTRRFIFGSGALTGSKVCVAVPWLKVMHISYKRAHSSRKAHKRVELLEEANVWILRGMCTSTVFHGANYRFNVQICRDWSLGMAIYRGEGQCLLMPAAGHVICTFPFGVTVCNTQGWHYRSFVSSGMT